ncbi:hypothetical protein [Jeotgalibacillus sp. ET6]|uniref:hypothetical protein n=1 Tax=Jeotgalibacillus sp. ET6 TaxID=3037260 RepID=UPI00301577D6
MPVIEHEITISAPIEICFDLARNVDIHTKTTGNTREKVISSKKTGLLEKGDRVQFEAVHFKIKQRLVSQIIQLERPYFF